METAKLKKFAQFARRSLLEQVSAKLKLVLAENSAARRESLDAIKKLEEAITRTSTEQVIERVAYIVGGHHTASKNDGLDFQVIWESDLLVNIEEDGLAAMKDKLPALIEKNFRTATGRNIAQSTYL